MERLEHILSFISAAPRARRLDVDPEKELNYGQVDFATDNTENPKNWSSTRKCYLTGVAILMVMNATFASSAPTGVIQGISDDLKVSVEAAGLVTTLFLLGYCAGPLFWAPLSEFYGRRWIFYITFTLYVTLNFLCAFTPDFGGLLAGRFLTGTAASAILSNGPGLISDIWGPVGRGNSMAIFMVATFCGPALGPVVAGFLEVTKTWRWCFYVLLWLGGLTEVFVLTVPETLPKVVLAKKARRMRQSKNNGSKTPDLEKKESLLSIFKTTLTRPWIILFDPISFLVAIYYCVVYTLLYMLFSIYPIVFQQKRGWNAGVGELPLIGTVIGACLGGAILLFIGSRERKAMKEGHTRTPEDRLPPAMAGGVLFALTMFWFAWTAEFNSIHWIVPTLAGTFLATAILLVFSGFIVFIIDSYLMYAASAVAANTVTRSACAAASPLFTQCMFDALGVGGGGSLIGGVGVLLVPIPFIFYRYGASIRKRSRFAPTDS
ncbi:hypothetical protein M409DRAFT_64149 [Zasmidium cellare ATCC 36951]|uniref:Cercosporin MFS transporter CTB4 n=1 Tax=Zasmidium cellare ATCC 36951 TaxID=1080233 RepID=A0A6A6CTH0_ZASCE|nr:uncharacterized protein M409DRAFT_64149 [Zasmidium cellare ATCC 36951]KAF2170391.1 hypothetical protein M409DRAFT_64149 [Zasmidium cellare ATCC 36951]